MTTNSILNHVQNIPNYLYSTYSPSILNKNIDYGILSNSGQISHELSQSNQLYLKKTDIGMNRDKYLSSWKSSIGNIKLEYQNELNKISSEINDISHTINAGKKLEEEYRKDLDNTMNHICNKIKTYSDNQMNIINTILQNQLFSNRNQYINQDDIEQNNTQINTQQQITTIFNKYRELSQIACVFFSNKEYKIANDEWLDCLLPIGSQEEHCKNILKKINDISLTNQNNILLCQNKQQKLTDIKNKIEDLEKEIIMISQLQSKT
jgi:hypothetical protein